MAPQEVRYETKAVQAIRGMEARTREKWEKDGWEFVEQAEPSLLRTKLTFRRPKKSVRGTLLIAGGCFAAAITAIIVLAVVGAAQRQPAASHSTTAPGVAAATPQSTFPAATQTLPTVQASSATGAGIEQAIKDAFGVKDFTEFYVQDPTIWAGYIAGVRDDGVGDVFITLQVSSDDTSRDALGQRAAQALSTLLPAASVQGVRWLIVEDASHVVIAQKQPAPLD